MLSYKNRPPQIPEDVELLEGASFKLESAAVASRQSRKAEGDNHYRGSISELEHAKANGMLYAYGVAIGTSLVAEVADPYNDIFGDGSFALSIFDRVREVVGDDECYKIIRAGMGSGLRHQETHLPTQERTL